MITEPKQIADMFSCLHDGRIVRVTAEDDRVQLEVQIRYLAERVDPGYRSFTVHLDDVTDLEFSTWPNDPNCGAVAFGPLWRPQFDADMLARPRGGCDALLSARDRELLLTTFQRALAVIGLPVVKAARQQ